MTHNAIKWQSNSLEELSIGGLFEYLKLRQQVFVVEQTCAYPDIDAKDKVAIHLLAWQGAEIIACSRILPAGVSYKHPSIGRIATTISQRGTGLGKELVARSIELSLAHYPGLPIEIGAQHRLERFYQGFDFETVSDVYLEDGIPHIDMLRP